VIDAWRTSCPRLTVWEDAVDRGYLVREPAPGRGTMVMVTAQGTRFLSENGRGSRVMPACDRTALVEVG
jgi:hypothetical protein